MIRQYLIKSLIFFLLFWSHYHTTTTLYGQQILNREYRSLRQSEVNVRVGPGLEYQIKFVYNLIDAPVQLLQSYDNWYKISDFEGEEGWVHRTMISQKKTIIVINDIVTLRDKAIDNAPAIAHAEKGVVMILNECTKDWCLVQLRDNKRNQNYKGWVKITQNISIWGAVQELLTK